MASACHFHVVRIALTHSCCVFTRGFTAAGRPPIKRRNIPSSCGAAPEGFSSTLMGRRSFPSIRISRWLYMLDRFSIWASNALELLCRPPRRRTGPESTISSPGSRKALQSSKLMALAAASPTTADGSLSEGTKCARACGKPSLPMAHVAATRTASSLSFKAALGEGAPATLPARAASDAQREGGAVAARSTGKRARGGVTSAVPVAPRDGLDDVLQPLWPVLLAFGNLRAPAQKRWPSTSQAAARMSFARTLARPKTAARLKAARTAAGSDQRERDATMALWKRWVASVLF
eukprot:scaffold119138_cov31-Tisochrysis_lutea.AAC.2